MAKSLLKGFLISKLKSRPVILSHLLTQKCSLSCPYCLWKNNSKEEMNLKEIMKVHKDASDNSFVGVFLWGGEPLLRKGIGKILEYDKSLGLWISLSTNGALLEKNSEIIARYVDELIVSIDAASEKHDKIRGMDGLFEKCVNGIRAVKRLNPNIHIKICYVVSKHNPDTIAEMANFARQEKCSLIIQQMDTKPAWGPSVAEHDISPDDRNIVLAQALQLKKQGYPIASSNAYLNHFYSPEKKAFCQSQKIYLTVWPNGDVRSCVDGSFIGNALAKGIKELLASSSYKEFLSAKCSKCRDAGTWESTYLYNLHPEVMWSLFKQLRQP